MPKGVPLIAAEGWPFLGINIALAVGGYYVGGLQGLVPFAALAVLIVFVFHDPDRHVPAAPLGVVSPVDGRVLEIVEDRDHCLQRRALRISLAIDNLSPYSLRSPVEGKVLDLRAGAEPGYADGCARGFWVRTDEKDDVVMMLRAPSLGRPQAKIRYGERLGQGQRCGYRRLAYRLELFLPLNSRSALKPGDHVRAGSGLVAQLVRK